MPLAGITDIVEAVVPNERSSGGRIVPTSSKQLRRIVTRRRGDVAFSSSGRDDREIRSEKIGARAVGSSAIGTQVIGTLAIGALALGALAIGAIAIGRLAVGRARIRRLEIDELVVRRLRITDDLETPGKIVERIPHANSEEH